MQFIQCCLISLPIISSGQPTQRSSATASLSPDFLLSTNSLFKCELDCYRVHSYIVVPWEWVIKVSNVSMRSYFLIILMKAIIEYADLYLAFLHWFISICNLEERPFKNECCLSDLLAECTTGVFLLLKSITLFWPFRWKRRCSQRNNDRYRSRNNALGTQGLLELILTNCDDSELNSHDIYVQGTWFFHCS